MHLNTLYHQKEEDDRTLTSLAQQEGNNTMGVVCVCCVLVCVGVGVWVCAYMKLEIWQNGLGVCSGLWKVWIYLYDDVFS